MLASSFFPSCLISLQGRCPDTQGGEPGFVSCPSCGMSNRPLRAEIQAERHGHGWRQPGKRACGAAPAATSVLNQSNHESCGDLPWGFECHQFTRGRARRRVNCDRLPWKTALGGVRWGRFCGGAQGSLKLSTARWTAAVVWRSERHLDTNNTWGFSDEPHPQARSATRWSDSSVTWGCALGIACIVRDERLVPPWRRCRGRGCIEGWPGLAASIWFPGRSHHLCLHRLPEPFRVECRFAEQDVVTGCRPNHKPKPDWRLLASSARGCLTES